MESPTNDSSSVTLIERLRVAEPDSFAWAEFVRRYGPQVDRWCRRWGLQGADAEDVTQIVLARVAARIRTFQRDRPRGFRGYLKSISHYAWHDFLETRRRAPIASGNTSMIDRLAEVEARDDLAARLEEAFDRELLDAAMLQVRERVEPHTWQAFQLCAIDGKSGAEAAATLGMEVATVYKARSKVQKMIHDEVQRLEQVAPQ